MNRLSVLLAGAALAATTGMASAATVYATGYNDVVAGIGAGAPGRDDPASALGAPDSLFYSLGLGGSIDLTFGQTFNAANVATTYEVTFGNVAKYPEHATLYALLGDTIVGFIGSVDNQAATSGARLTFAGMFDGIRVIDTTPSGSPSDDGFDLNALGVAPVPLPAAGLLLAGGLAGLGLVRRKRA